VKQAIEFGYAAAGGTGRLIIVDSGITEESAIAAAEQLVFDEGAIAIAGPLLSNQADAVAAAMDAMRVPLVGLAQSLSPGEEQEWVFRATVAVEDQVGALVDHTTGTVGMTTYGIFAPDNDYGRGAAAAFTAKVESMGGRIVDSKFYNPDSNDMTGAARQMSRSPMEGLFIPDSASRVPLACAGLAYEEFPVGDFQPVPGGPTIQLLGLNSWNNEDILTQGGAYVRNALFTELFINDTTASEQFAAAYQSQVDRTPSPLEAVVSDVGRLLATVDQAGVTDRAGYRAALEATAPEGTVTGLNGFNADTRTASHNLRILTITRDSIEVVK
jgi:ABC-type branched-subunit amino acid transport system substrate-binding protein